MYRPRPPRRHPARLAREMRWRVAALIAVCGIAGIPAASDAAQPSGTALLHVSVKPPAGSSRTHFAISFRAGVASAGSTNRTYRVTASDRGRGGCQSIATAQVPAPRDGTGVRVVLSPSRSAGWCAGVFSGQVWSELTIICVHGEACLAILPRPELVGRFTFRVTRG
jgi:hypothetical protein